MASPRIAGDLKLLAPALPVGGQIEPLRPLEPVVERLQSRMRETRYVRACRTPGQPDTIAPPLSTNPSGSSVRSTSPPHAGSGRAAASGARPRPPPPPDTAVAPHPGTTPAHRGGTARGSAPRASATPAAAPPAASTAPRRAPSPAPAPRPDRGCRPGRATPPRPPSNRSTACGTHPAAGSRRPAPDPRRPAPPPRQRIDVPVDRPHRDLELVRQRLGGHPPPGLQQQQQGQQASRLHRRQYGRS